VVDHEDVYRTQRGFTPVEQQRDIGRVAQIGLVRDRGRTARANLAD
jgi:hypothetical protein